MCDAKWFLFKSKFQNMNFFMTKKWIQMTLEISCHESLPNEEPRCPKKLNLISNIGSVIMEILQATTWSEVQTMAKSTIFMVRQIREKIPKCWNNMWWENQFVNYVYGVHRFKRRIKYAQLKQRLSFQWNATILTKYFWQCNSIFWLEKLIKFFFSSITTSNKNDVAREL